MQLTIALIGCILGSLCHRIFLQKKEKWTRENHEDVDEQDARQEFAQTETPQDRRKSPFVSLAHHTVQNERYGIIYKYIIFGLLALEMSKGCLMDQQNRSCYTFHGPGANHSSIMEL